MAETLYDVAVRVIADTSDLPETIKDGLEDAGAPAEKAGKEVGEEFSDALSKSAKSSLGKSARRFADPLAEAVRRAASGVQKNASRVFGGLGRVAERAFTPIRTAASRVASSVSSVWGKIGSGVSKAFTPIKTAATTAFAGVRTAAEKISAPVRKVMDSTFGKKVTSGFSKIGSAAQTAFGKIPGIASSAGSKIRTGLSKLASATGSVLGKIGSAAGSAFGKIAEIAKAGMDRAVAVVKTGAKIGLAAAAAGLGVALTKGFSRLTGIENAEASLKGLGYTAKEAADVISGPVMDAVSGTAFGLDEAAQAAQGALGAGVENGTALKDYLTLVGDAASQAQVDFGSMALMMNKVQGQGKLTGEVMQQMAENGLQVMPMLTEAYGKSAEEITKMVSEGKISAAEFQKILKENIGGAAQEAGKTVTGSFRNMGAAMGRLGAKFLGGTFDQLPKLFNSISKILDGIGPRAEKLGNSLGKFLKPAIDQVVEFAKIVEKGGGFGDLAAGLSPVMTIVKAAIPVLTAFGSVFKNVIQDQMASFAAAIKTIDPQPFIDGFIAIGQAVTSLVYSFGKIDLSKLFAALVNAFGSVLAVLPKILPPLMQFISVLADAAATILPIIAKVLGQVGAALGSALGDVLKAIMPSLTIFIKVLAGTLAKVLPVVAKLIGVLATILGDALAAALPPLLQLLTPLVEILGDLLLAVLPPLIKIMTEWAPLITLNAKLIGFLATAVTEIISALVAVVTGTKDFKTAMSDAFSNIGKAFQPIIDAAEWVYDKLFGHSIFPDMLDAMTGWVKDIGTALGSLFSGIKKIFNKISNWVTGTWKAAWGKVSGIMSGAVSKGKEKIGKLWDGARDSFSDARKWTATTWKNAWSKVSGWMSGAVETGKNKIGDFWGKARDKFTAARKWTGSTWKNNWSKVSGWMSGAVEKGRTKIGTAWGSAKDKFTGARKWVTGDWKSRWNKISEVIAHPVRSAKEMIRTILGNEGVRKIFRAAITAIETIWNKLEGIMARPVNWVIKNVLTPLINAIKKVGTTVGVPGAKDLVPPSPIKGYATGGIAETGGIMPGYTPGRDTSLIGVGGGEAIMRPEFTRAVGSGFVYAANSAARTGGVQGAKQFLAQSRYGRYAGGFASGGVAPVPGRGNRHTSGYGWATWAGDYPNPTGTPVKAWKDGIVAAVQHLTTSYGQHVRVNHDDGTSSLYAHLSRIMTSVGDKLSGGEVLGQVGSTGNSTGPHLHFETMGGPFNGGTAAEDTSLGSGIMNLITKLKTMADVNLPGRFGDNIWTDTLLAAPKVLANAAFTKLKDLAANIGDGVMSGASWVGSKLAGLGTEQRNNAAKIIDVAHQLGFGDRGAIIGLITGLVESGLRNLSWGDRDSVGVFQQRAPWGSFADRTNVSKSASMFFLGGQGGQPGLRDKNWRTGGLGALAQAVQVSAFPGRYSLEVPRAQMILAAFKAGSKKYDGGGWLPPGYSMAFNGTGRQENKAVFTEDQWQTLQDIARGRDRSPHRDQPTQIHLHGIIDSASAAREIEQMLINRGRTVGGVNLPSRSRKLVRST